ncbi:hypothetical protein CDCA_CDCA16G4137 [Cyanidium caldarium]|uniref:Uncharacterized protein n=1 Tax=Cyanidium caldarium TaxID=2771 RepID=A0AAV9J0K2_CYACA|nr:hypothetical protein CDCA_CDCA16G4137 [Cyanidium caldarium]
MGWTVHGRPPPTPLFTLSILFFPSAPMMRRTAECVVRSGWRVGGDGLDGAWPPTADTPIHALYPLLPLRPYDEAHRGMRRAKRVACRGRWAGRCMAAHRRHPYSRSLSSSSPPPLLPRSLS